MDSTTLKSGDREKRTKARTVTLALWTLLWVLSVALATFGHTLFWGSNMLANLFVIVLNFGAGIGMIWANIYHLREMDEMLQKVHLEAMGITLGLALVGGIAYSLLDVTNVISMDAEISGLIILMGLTYITAVLINLRKYR